MGICSFYKGGNWNSEESGGLKSCYWLVATHGLEPRHSDLQPVFSPGTCPPVTCRAAEQPFHHFSGGRRSQQHWAILETLPGAMELWVFARPLQGGVPPLPCIYFLSLTSQNHKNQRRLLSSLPSSSLNTQPQAVDSRATTLVSLLLLTQVCLPGAVFPISLPRNLCSPQIYALGRRGIYGVFITHPTPGHGTSPCSCQNHPLVPSEVSVHWGKLLGNNAQF